MEVLHCFEFPESLGLDSQGAKIHPAEDYFYPNK
jgi:hypothetical protein